MRNNRKLLLLLIYVDDLLISGNDEAAISALKEKLKQEFEMTDLGTASSYLGVDIHRKSDGIFISQKGYIEKLLTKFHMQHCNSIDLPTEPKTYLRKDTSSPKIDPASYRSLVGSLLYLAHTRPDISYAISCVSRYMQEPEEAHLQAAKRILKYLKGTKNYGMFFPNTETGILHIYADADWGMDPDIRRSTSGILHRFGNTSISWSSKLQHTVSLSSTEAEYRTLTNAAKDVTHFRRLLWELGIPEQF